MQKGRFLRSVIALCCAAAILFTGITLRADAGFKAFNQNDYGHIPYGKYGTLQSGGCGAVAWMNCVYYLTGKKLDPTFVANYSVSVGARQYGSGTSVRLLAQRFCEDYGAAYQITNPGTYGSLWDMKSYVGNGKAAICAILSGSSAGHYIVLAEYDWNSDCFYILDANPRDVRNTWPNGVGWLSARKLSDLCANKFTRVEYYGGAFSYTDAPPTTTTTTRPPTTTDEYYEELRAGNIVPEITPNGHDIIIRHTQRQVTVAEILDLEPWRQLADGAVSADYYAKSGDALQPTDYVGTGCKIHFRKHGEEEIYTVIFLGDVDYDGKINSRDARLLLRHAAKTETLPFVAVQAADADRNGTVNAADARKLLRYSAKITLI